MVLLLIKKNLKYTIWENKMKIRNGFVSNSSSSSFVVAFPKMPKDVQELKQILFWDQQSYT